MNETSVGNGLIIQDHKISFNQLRDRLRHGLELLLTMLPKGDNPRHDLILLRDFSNIVEALVEHPSGTGYPPKKVLEIMGDFGGGTQLTLIEATDAFTQQFLD